MSVAGLRKVGNFESALAAATKDEQFIDGIISPYLQREATKIINSPLFQRVNERLGDDLIEQEKTHTEQKNFQNQITNLSVDARINRNDLEYIVNNLQQPSAPLQPPPPQNDAGADRERLIAELDGMAQERERRMRQDMIGAQNTQFLAAQQVISPAQQIVNHYHTPANPQPIFVQPDMTSATDAMRQFGHSFTQMFLRQQAGQDERRRFPQDDIQITYAQDNRPPPSAPPVPAQDPSPNPIKVIKLQKQKFQSPAKLAKIRTAPFSTGAALPVPGGGGATAPMPVASPVDPLVPAPVVAPQSIPAAGPPRRLKKPKQPRVIPDPSPPSHPYGPISKFIKPKYGPLIQPEPFEPSPAPPHVERKRLQNDQNISSKEQRIDVPRFAGKGHRILDFPKQRVEPFSGTGHYIDFVDPHKLIANARARMQDIWHRHQQTHRKREMVDRGDDLRRAIARGGERGDVVPLGKRKRDFGEFDPNIRRKIGNRVSGPEMFTLF